MSDTKPRVHFDCPWCGKSQTKTVGYAVEFEVVCNACKNSALIETNSEGIAIRIRRSSTINSIKSSEQTPRTHTRSDTHNNNPSVNIGSVYGSVSFGGDVNITNIYNETVALINAAKNVNEEQKLRLRKLLEHAKENAPEFLQALQLAIKIFLGQA